MLLRFCSELSALSDFSINLVEGEKGSFAHLSVTSKKASGMPAGGLSR